MEFKEIMEQKKKETLEFHGINKWHEMKYKGQGINFLEIEDANDHGRMVRDTFKLVAPESNAYLGHMRNRVSGDKVIFCDIYYGGEYIPIKEFVNKYDIHIIGASLGYSEGNSDGFPEPLIEYLKELPVIFVGSAGNEGYLGVTGKFENLGIMSGAIRIKDGKILKEIYSGVEHTMDFATLHSWPEGTSFSSPVLAGIIALILCRYGRMTQLEVYEALKGICIDPGEKGHDNKFGWGVPVLLEEMEIKNPKNFEQIFGIPLIQDPIENFNKREGYPMDADYITIHNFGTDHLAENVTEYIDDIDEVKSWHFTVGKHAIYQEMPININAWHAGDGLNGEGNRNSIAIEIEENEEAMQNAIKLVAWLRSFKKYEIKTHQDWSGKYCPRWILDNYSKEYFIKEVELMEHWAEEYYQKLLDAGVVIHEKRYDDKITRGEMFALLSRILDKINK